MELTVLCHEKDHRGWEIKNIGKIRSLVVTLGRADLSHEITALKNTNFRNMEYAV